MAESGDPPPTSLSEGDMLELLSKKYDFLPRSSDSGARPKVSPLMSLSEQQPHTHFTYSPVPPVVVPAKVPKMPLFSGDQPTPRSEVSFYEWRHKVRCLRRDTSLSESQVLQALRTSLRGTARRLIVSLGDAVSVEAALRKLELNFGELSLKGVSMREFFNLAQR